MAERSDLEGRDAQRSVDELSEDDRRLASAAAGSRREGRRTRGWSDDGPRDRPVTIYFSEQERAEVDSVAARLGMRPGAWIGELATRYARGQLRPLPQTERDLIATWMQRHVDVLRAGTVINQVAKHANATGEFTEDTARLLALAERLLSRVDEATERANARAGRAR